MYTYKSRVRYSETGTDMRLTLEGIINYMQDCSSFHYEDLGCSNSYLESIELGWILNSWQLIIERRPEAFEPITIGTLAYDFKGIYGYRNFVIEDEAGNRCAYANTVWVLMNTKTGKPTKVVPEAVKGYSSQPKLPMEYKDRKIHPPDSMRSFESFPVLKTHLDSNHHVNNSKYIQMAMEYLPGEFEAGELRVQYIKSALLGDIIIPKMAYRDNKHYISLEDSAGSVYAALEFTGRE